MLTPIRVAVVAAVLGIGTAIWVSMQAPPPPAEDAASPVADSSSLNSSLTMGPPSPTSSGASGPTSQPTFKFKLADGPKTKTASGLTYIDVAEGSGLAAKAGDTIQVGYVGRVYENGTQFDSSYDRGPPMTATLSPGGLISGFVEGMIGMKVGGKRELIIPPALGYGEAGRPRANIPANSTLVFDVELVSIVPVK